MRHIVFLIACILFILFNFEESHGVITDTLSHIPPTNGSYPFSPPGNWHPGTSGFLSIGESYNDPVFDQKITRLTDTYPSGAAHCSYSCKQIFNADASMVYVISSYAIYDLNGNPLRQRNAMRDFSPYGVDNFSWHPTDPDKLLFITNNAIGEYSYSANGAQTIKTFGSGLNNGGTSEICDGSGRYYAGMVGGTLRFYDRTDDVFYANQPTGISGNDYICIAPDGSGVLVVGGGIKDDTEWYPVDHNAQSFKTGDAIKAVCNSTAHGDIITGSDGITCFLADCSGVTRVAGNISVGGPHLLKIPVENPQNYERLLVDKLWKHDGHFGCNAYGTNCDWAVISLSCNDGDFNSNWDAYDNEIFLLNIQTGARRRLAHHRSCGMSSQYWLWAKASISADGQYVIWNSNFGRTNGDYADCYMVETGLPSTSIRWVNHSLSKNIKMNSGNIVRFYNAPLWPTGKTGIIFDVFGRRVSPNALKARGYISNFINPGASPVSGIFFCRVKE